MQSAECQTSATFPAVSQRRDDTRRRAFRGEGGFAAGTDAEIQRRAAEIVKAYPQWYHTIDLAPGVTTPGMAPLEAWKGTLRKLGLPDLRGKSGGRPI